jgi:hypothetical protein
MLATKTRRPVVIAAAIVAAVGALAAVLVLALGGGGPPSSLQAPAPLSHTGRAPRWTDRVIRFGYPRALRVDARGHAYVLSSVGGGWALGRQAGPATIFPVAAYALRSSSFANNPDSGADFGLDRRGQSIVVWAATTGRHAQTLMSSIDGHVASIARGDIQLSDPIESPAASGSLAVSPDGSAIVAWTAQDADGDRVLSVAQRQPGASRFGAPHELGVTMSNPAVLADAAGGQTVVWTGRVHDDGSTDIYAFSRPPHGRFGRPVALGTTDPFADFAAATGRRGRTIVVFEGPRASSVEAVQRQAGQKTFDDPVTLIRSPKEISGSEGVVIPDRGPAMIAWSNGVGDHTAMAEATWPAAARPSAPRQLTRFNVGGHVLEGGPRVFDTAAGPVVVFVHSGDPAWFALTPAGRLAALPRAADTTTLFAAGPSGLAAVYDDDHSGFAVHLAQLRVTR